MSNPKKVAVIDTASAAVAKTEARAAAVASFLGDQPTPEISPAKQSLLREIESYLRNSGGRAVGAGLIYATNWTALVNAGLLTEENAGQGGVNRTVALLAELDHQVSDLAIRAQGLTPEPYTLTPEEQAQVTACAREASVAGITDPGPICTALMGSAVLKADPVALGRFRRLAREAGVDAGFLDD